MVTWLHDECHAHPITAHRFPGAIIATAWWLYFRFLSIFSTIYDLFSVGCHCLKAKHFRILLARRFETWRHVTGVVFTAAKRYFQIGMSVAQFPTGQWLQE